MRTPASRRRGLGAALLVASLAAAPRASADGYTFRFEPSYILNTTEVRDAGGRVDRSRARAFTETYRLTLDKRVYGSVRFTGIGGLTDSQVRTEAGGIRTDNDERQWNGAANLTWGNPVLGGGFGYSRSDTRGGVTTSGGILTATDVGRGNVNETWSAFTRWRPLDLPSLDARVSRSTDRAVGRDLTTRQATLNAGYVPVRPLDLRYTLAYAESTDEVSRVDTTSLLQTGRVTYADELFRRSNVYLAYNASRTTFETEAPGEGGIVSLQRSPVAGWSLVQQPVVAVPPEISTLEANPAVVDGNLGATTGIDLGWEPTLAGDETPREVGVQFADDTEPVNTLHVWIDRPLTPAVSTSYAWAVYRSTDNRQWTPVAIVRGVVFGAADNRFEITTEEIRAPYVKVVSAPLPASLSGNVAVQNVLVTELRAFLVVPAASLQGKTTTVRDSVNGTVTTRLLPSPNLRHDLSFAVNRLRSSVTSWVVSNGLSMTHRLTPILGLSARLARTDSGASGRHVGETLYGATLAATPTPTLASSLSLTGTVTQVPEGTGVRNTASASASARVYEGVETSGNLSYSIATAPDDRTTRSAVASANASITPHRLITFTAGAGTNRQDVSGGGAPDATLTSSRLDLTASSSPFPAMFLSAGVRRLITSGTRPRTLADFNISWSPLADAAFSLQLAHSQSLDTASESISRSSQASVRWRILRILELNSGYTLAELDALQLDTTTRGFFVTLLLTLS